MNYLTLILFVLHRGIDYLLLCDRWSDAGLLLLYQVGVAANGAFVISLLVFFLRGV